jgi:hypothetical protein
LSQSALRKEAWNRQHKDLFDYNEDAAQWLMEGTQFGGNRELNFTFAENGLTLYFQPYQVAPFAFGTWEVTLPYYDLREILRGPHRLFMPPKNET